MALKQDTTNLEKDVNLTKISFDLAGEESFLFDQTAFQNTVPLEYSKIESGKISGIPFLDRAKVLQTTQAIYPIVKNWLTDYSIFPLKKLPTLCLTAAAISPDSSVEVATELAIFLMILIGIDDVMDERAKSGLHLNEARQLLKEWDKIVKDRGVISKHNNGFTIPRPVLATSHEQISQALARFCRNLKKFTHAEAYYPLLTHRFSLVMSSMDLELVWQEELKTHGTYPAYQDYLVNGRESIEIPAVMAAFLVLNGPSWEYLDANISNSLVQKRITSQLEEVFFSCGSSIRLANDVGGFERELVEQKPNSVSILLHQQKILWAVKTDQKMEQVFLKNVKDAVLREADNYQQQLEKQVSRLPEALNVWGDSMLRITKFCRDFALAGEFYSLSLEMLKQLKPHLN